MDVFLQNAPEKGEDKKENDYVEDRTKDSSQQSWWSYLRDSEQVGTIKLQESKMFPSKINF